MIRNEILIDELLFYSHNRYDDNPHTGTHLHDSHEIYLLMNGQVDYFIEGNVYSVTEHDLIVTNRNELHSVIFKSGSDYERCCVRLAPMYFMEDNYKSLENCFLHLPKGSMNIIRLNDEQLDLLLGMILKIDSLVSDRDAFERELSIAALLLQLIIEVNRCFSQNKAEMTKASLPEWIEGVITYVHNCVNDESRIAEVADIAQIADRFFVNKDYLRMAFKKHTGINLFAYIQTLKIRRAKILLGQGKSVTETAFLCGFSDYCSFIRSFKRICRVTPGQYARQIRIK